MSVSRPVEVPLKAQADHLYLQRQQTKAAHYILSLDEARCNGDWNAVPELVRKIRKHAPDRVCMFHPN
jgi:hypothetical protein